MNFKKHFFRRRDSIHLLGILKLIPFVEGWQKIELSDLVWVELLFQRSDEK